MIEIRTNAKQYADKYAALARQTPISATKMMSEIGNLALEKAKDASTRFKSPERKGLKKMGHPFAKRHADTGGEGVKIAAVNRRRAGVIRALQSGKGSGLSTTGLKSFMQKSGGTSYLPYPPEYIGRDYGSPGKSFAESWGWDPDRRGHDYYAVIYNDKKDSNGFPLLATLIDGKGTMIPRRIDLLVKRMTLRDAFNKAANLISGIYQYVSRRSGTKIMKTSQGTFFQSAGGNVSVSWKNKE